MRTNVRATRSILSAISFPMTKNADRNSAGALVARQILPEYTNVYIRSL